MFYILIKTSIKGICALHGKIRNDVDQSKDVDKGIYQSVDNRLLCFKKNVRTVYLSAAEKNSLIFKATPLTVNL